MTGYNTGYKHKIDYSLLDKDDPVRVLAVEDDALAMKFLEKQIAFWGHEILKAENGRASLTVLEDNADGIDVVLMDREMPVMDGLEAVRRIKDNPRLRNIPVIMVTCADSAQNTVDEPDQARRRHWSHFSANSKIRTRREPDRSKPAVRIERSARRSRIVFFR